MKHTTEKHINDTHTASTNASVSGCPADKSLRTNICFGTKEERERKKTKKNKSEIINTRIISMHIESHDEVPASM